MLVQRHALQHVRDVAVLGAPALQALQAVGQRPDLQGLVPAQDEAVLCGPHHDMYYQPQKNGTAFIPHVGVHSTPYTFGI